MMGTTWTKEQLKSLAGVTSEQKAEEISANFSEDDAIISSRKINKRAIPKILFSAALLTPALGLVYFFASNNLSINNREVGVKAAEPDSQTKELKEQLETANEKIDELEAKMAVIKQEQSFQEQEEIDKPSPTAEEEKEEETPPQKVARRSATPPPVAKPVARRSATPPPVRSKPKPLVSNPKPTPPPIPVIPSVYGAGTIEDIKSEAVKGASSKKENNANYLNGKSLPSVLEIANNVPNVDPELEAPLLQERQMLLLRTGTSAKASLVAPWVQDFYSREGDALFRVVLQTPLMAAQNTVFLPAQTIILVRAEFLGQPDLLEFVGVEAQIPSSSISSTARITLPEGVIRFSAENGAPLVALPVPDKSSKKEGGLLEVLDSAEQTWRIAEEIGQDSLVEDLLRSQDRIRTILNERNRERGDSELFFLPVGTKLKLTVETEVTVPAVVSQRQVQTQPEQLPTIRSYDRQPRYPLPRRLEDF